MEAPAAGTIGAEVFGCPRRLDGETTALPGLAACVHCGGAIRPGELFLPAGQCALEELTSLLRLQRTAIMCAETVYWRCHRSLVADALLVRGIESLHLLQRGKAVAHTLTRFARPQGRRILYPPVDQ